MTVGRTRELAGMTEVFETKRTCDESMVARAIVA
jgi:hypothetical protein